MDPQEQEQDPALTAANYSPPAQVATNTDIQALINQAVQQALADQVQAAQPRELSPEEKTRGAIDNRGAGLGVEERLAEIYEMLHHLAQKVGV